MTAREKVVEAIREFHFWNYGMDDVDPKSEYAEWVPALADQICAALDDQPFHVLDVGDQGWTLKHPLDCRDGLFDCPFNLAAERLSGPPAEYGRYRVELAEAGGLEIGVSVGAEP